LLSRQIIFLGELNLRGLIRVTEGTHWTIKVTIMS
jgi:hypothetical protein